MKVLVVGAAGRTGRAVVERAVAAGHEVTAFARTGTGDPVPGVRVHAGEGTDAAAVRAAVAGQDAVVDTVGGKTPDQPTTLETDVATTVIAAMQHHGVARLVVTSSIGVGDSVQNAPSSTMDLVATFLRGSTADKTGMESAVRASGLDWVIARPAVLTDEPATGGVRVFSPDRREEAHTIPRADLAAFLVAQLTSDEHLRQAVTLASR